MLLDKPALLNWANKQGLLGIDINKDRNKWLNAGTSIHNQISNFHVNKTPFQSQDVEDRYKRFISGKIVLDCEKDIETDWFQGRLDMRIKDGNDIIMVDYKNNAKGVYFEHKLQLVGYGMGVECNKFQIVSLPMFTVMAVVIQDRKPYEEILKALSHIYKYKNIIENV